MPRVAQQERSVEDVIPLSKPTRDRVFRWVWNYFRGCVVIVALLLGARAAEEGYSRVASWLEPLAGAFQSSAPSVVLTTIILIIGPWSVGRVVELLLAGKLFRRRRGFRAYRRMESKLATELRSDHKRGYRVALVNWPSAETRTLGLVVGNMRDPDSGRDLAAVYLPGTPDPTKGAVRIIAKEDLQMTDWGLSDLSRFHVTFGSASPDFADSQDDGK